MLIAAILWFRIALGAGPDLMSPLPGVDGVVSLASLKTSPQKSADLPRIVAYPRPDRSEGEPPVICECSSADESEDGEIWAWVNPAYAGVAWADPIPKAPAFVPGPHLWGPPLHGSTRLRC